MRGAGLAGLALCFRGTGAGSVEGAALCLLQPREVVAVRGLRHLGLVLQPRDGGFAGGRAGFGFLARLLGLAHGDTRLVGGTLRVERRGAGRVELPADVGELRALKLDGIGALLPHLRDGGVERPGVLRALRDEFVGQIVDAREEPVPFVHVERGAGVQREAVRVVAGVRGRVGGAHEAIDAGPEGPEDALREGLCVARGHAREAHRQRVRGALPEGHVRGEREHLRVGRRDALRVEGVDRGHLRDGGGPRVGVQGGDGGRGVRLGRVGGSTHAEGLAPRGQNASTVAPTPGAAPALVASSDARATGPADRRAR